MMVATLVLMHCIPKSLYNGWIVHVLPSLLDGTMSICMEQRSCAFLYRSEQVPMNSWIQIRVVFGATGRRGWLM